MSVVRAAVGMLGATVWLFVAGCERSSERRGGAACRADCDCDPPGYDCCVDGECRPCGRRITDTCGPPESGRWPCSCLGGTCVEHCCILSDGGIANGFDPVCTARVDADMPDAEKTTDAPVDAEPDGM